MLHVAVFDTHGFDREALEGAVRELPGPEGARAGAREGAFGVEFHFLEPRLSARTAALSAGCEAVCVFVNDRVDAEALEVLASVGVRMVALRCAGFNNVDLRAAERLGIAVARVPEYSPHAVAEHAVALLLALNRKLVRASSRVRDGNFLLEGLVGFDLHGKTVGVIGTGHIGAAFARIMHGFGCRVLGMDPKPDAALIRDTGIEYCSLSELLGASDIVSLHLPLNDSSRHLINAQTISMMRKGVTLINTGRGALIDTPELVAALKSGQIGAAGLDVYEEEEGVFFEDHSGEVLNDEKLAWLLMCPNTLVTAHQAFLTREALHQLASGTVANLRSVFAAGGADAPPPAQADGRSWLVVPRLRIGVDS